MFSQFKLFSIFLCEQNMGLRDLQILGFCSYLHFLTSSPAFLEQGLYVHVQLLLLLGQSYHSSCTTVLIIFEM